MLRHGDAGWEHAAYPLGRMPPRSMQVQPGPTGWREEERPYPRPWSCPRNMGVRRSRDLHLIASDGQFYGGTPRTVWREAEGLKRIAREKMESQEPSFPTQGVLPKEETGATKFISENRTHPLRPFPPPCPFSAEFGAPRRAYEQNVGCCSTTVLVNSFTKSRRADRS